MRTLCVCMALIFGAWTQADAYAEPKCHACGTVIAVKVEDKPATGCHVIAQTQTRKKPITPDGPNMAYWEEVSSMSGQVEAAQTREPGFSWRHDPNWKPEPVPAKPAVPIEKISHPNSAEAKSCASVEKRYGVVTSIDGGQATDWFSSPPNFKVGDKIQIVGGLLKLRASLAQK